MPITKIATSSIELQYENYINILRAGQSVSDTGWSTYSNTAGVNPVSGIGGTASITWSQNTSSPLSGDADLRLVKGATNRQGDGVSIPFTIANRHLGKVLQISFDMELISGTYSTGDLRVSVIQDPSGTPVLLEPVGTSLELGTANQRMREIATFQTHISITSYRLCVHVSSTSTSAYTVDFANFRVWEQQQSLGAVITDWVSYTPTFTGLGTVTSIDYVWRRVGGYLEVIGRHINGTCTGSTIGISLPSGLVVQSNGNVYTELAGLLHRDLGAEQYCINVMDSDTSFGVGNTNGSANPFAKITGTSSSMDNMALRMWARVRIKGWGSNVAMSSDTGDGRVVAAKYIGNTSTSINPVRYATREIDTHNSYNPSTGIFTVPISGIYQFSAMYQNDTVGADLKIRKNGVANVSLLQVPSSSANYRMGGAAIIQANAGDTIDMISGSGNTLSSATDTHLSIIRISAGSQIIATQETVSASYYSSANQTSLTTQINFGTILYDTHGAVTTGSSWKFTAPMNGKYLVTYNLGVSTTAQQFIEVWKSGSLYRRNVNGGANHGSSSFQLNLLAGEYFDLRPNSSMTVSGSSSNDGNRSFIEITRIGN